MSEPKKEILSFSYQHPHFTPFWIYFFIPTPIFDDDKLCLITDLVFARNYVANVVLRGSLGKRVSELIEVSAFVDPTTHGLEARVLGKCYQQVRDYKGWTLCPLCFRTSGAKIPVVNLRTLVRFYHYLADEKAVRIYTTPHDKVGRFELDPERQHRLTIWREMTTSDRQRLSLWCSWLSGLLSKGEQELQVPVRWVKPVSPKPEPMDIDLPLPPVKPKSKLDPFTFDWPQWEPIPAVVVYPPTPAKAPPEPVLAKPSPGVVQPQPVMGKAPPWWEMAPPEVVFKFPGQEKKGLAVISNPWLDDNTIWKWLQRLIDTKYANYRKSIDVGYFTDPSFFAGQLASFYDDPTPFEAHEHVLSRVRRLRGMREGRIVFTMLNTEKFVHWRLLVIDSRQMQISFFDSFGQSIRQRAADQYLVRVLLQAYAGFRLVDLEWPCQSNEDPNECGTYTVWAAHHYLSWAFDADYRPDSRFLFSDQTRGRTAEFDLLLGVPGKIKRLPDVGESNLENTRNMQRLRTEYVSKFGS